MEYENCNHSCCNQDLKTNKKGIEKHLERVLGNSRIGEIKKLVLTDIVHILINTLTIYNIIIYSNIYLKQC